MAKWRALTLPCGHRTRSQFLSLGTLTTGQKGSTYYFQGGMDREYGKDSSAMLNMVRHINTLWRRQVGRRLISQIPLVSIPKHRPKRLPSFGHRNTTGTMTNG